MIQSNRKTLIFYSFWVSFRSLFIFDVCFAWRLTTAVNVGCVSVGNLWINHRYYFTFSQFWALLTAWKHKVLWKYCHNKPFVAYCVLEMFRKRYNNKLWTRDCQTKSSHQSSHIYYFHSSISSLFRNSYASGFNPIRAYFQHERIECYRLRIESRLWRSYLNGLWFRLCSQSMRSQCVYQILEISEAAECTSFSH